MCCASLREAVGTEALGPQQHSILMEKPSGVNHLSAMAEAPSRKSPPANMYQISDAPPDDDDDGSPVTSRRVGVGVPVMVRAWAWGGIWRQSCYAKSPEARRTL